MKLSEKLKDEVIKEYAPWIMEDVIREVKSLEKKIENLYSIEEIEDLILSILKLSSMIDDPYIKKQVDEIMEKYKSMKPQSE